MAIVSILLGGNVGDKSEIFARTKNLIRERIGIITKMSSVYATESWGFDSDFFWNQVITVESGLDPFSVLSHTQAIEREMGRIKKGTGYEAGIIDIDLLFYDDLVVNTPILTIPHPRIGERKFVLIPLIELDPERKDPVSGLTVQELLNRCQDQLKVERTG
jgi:2-amino-4-hydroxy-6-hydroxymethyldihydropteridine diphosphokinase